MKSPNLRMCTTSCFLLVIILSSLSLQARGSQEANRPTVNVVIVGGTGDLAKKYLWQGFFNLNQEQNDGFTFSVIGAARMAATEGDGQLAKILQDNVSCAKSVRPDENCEAKLTEYRSIVTYRKLKTASDYADLCHEIGQDAAKEHGRLFYLSVPPFAYAGIAENIARACRPSGGGWLRVVLEKPFGRDYSSAQDLAKKLSPHLQEEEIYRIDHYLGKIGVESILPFRMLNQDTYKKLWDGEHIERVEIVMKEKIDSKGRLEFYDEYGVIRDVMQNHLTEIFTLVAMELPRNITSRAEFLDNKIRLLAQTRPVNAEQAVIAQYNGYVDQWRDELGKDQSEETLVPTFAAGSLFVKNPRWSDVPFVLMAGKKLDERIGYVRVIFRDDAVCVTNAGSDSQNKCAKNRQQVIFFTGNPGLKYPSILVSKQLPKPQVPPTWSVPDTDPNMEIFNEKISNFYYFSPPKDQDAYTSLISACFKGDQQKFVGSRDLMASWNIWTPLLKSIEKQTPRIYEGGDDTGSWLDFKVKGQTLSYIHQLSNAFDYQNVGSSFTSISDQFRSQSLITGEKESVITQLAQHLFNIAGQSIRERGSFHIALPGGSTPKSLFTHLAIRMSNRFPWHDTHFWMVDERCVPFNHTASNFKQLHDSLLKYIPVPYLNIHPMPVKLASGLCAAADHGTNTYASDLTLIPEGRLDYILLGMGSDGHVASIFPNHKIMTDTTAKVALTDGGPQDGIPHRMTLTFATINKARHVGVLVLGRAKSGMVSVLSSEGVVNPLRYPVTGVRLEQGEQYWYIDHDALL
ncbi:GDH/6PGL endoplasmic bifunctional protein-like [Asterias rubens]|uniref:GDH/6PGL endoplasmic bifunctional protein-like n=1 Tax=Asterias rubens TaxID=7604 RepID=UPI0014559898|nr:GDH/6PGL endoplasmic bifunctional protein-like [Asterias rubens]